MPMSSYPAGGLFPVSLRDSCTLVEGSLLFVFLRQGFTVQLEDKFYP